MEEDEIQYSSYVIKAKSVITKYVNVKFTIVNYI